MVCFTWEDTQRLFIFTGTLAHDPMNDAEFLAGPSARVPISAFMKLQRHCFVFSQLENTRNVALGGRSDLRRFAVSAAARHCVWLLMTIWFSRPGSSYFPRDHIFVFSQLRKHGEPPLA
jgi:hypothetical protein